MGMDLKSANGGTFYFSGMTWSLYLSVAKVYGWEPEGTKRPETLSPTENWDGSYDLNGGQLVTQSDAQNLSDALALAS